MRLRARLKRIAVFLGKGCLWSILFLVVLVGFIWGSWWINSREEVDYAWETAIENTSGHARSLYLEDGKHRGVSLMVERVIEKEDLDRLVQNNFEWVALHPYGWQSEGYNATGISYGKGDVIRWSIRDSTLAVLAGYAKTVGLHIFLKPHLWLSGGEVSKWRSDIAMDSEEDWQAWFSSYGRFMLHYARLADSLDIPMLSVGTELHQATVQREADWRALIGQIRTVYHGRLIYSANWHEEYEQIRFWDALDAIGVQAYFPLTKSKFPTVEELRTGWAPHKQKLEALSVRYGKPVIFTELGYKSTAGTAIEPWEWVTGVTLAFERVSVTTQANAYQAFFDVFWHEPWFEGMYVWRWSRRHDAIGGRSDRSFYIQNKPAQNVVARRFAQVGIWADSLSAH